MRICTDPRTCLDLEPESRRSSTTSSTPTEGVLTPAEVKKGLHARGIAVSTWAQSKGFPRALVYAVLRGHRKCLRGTSHDIAVALGLKTREAGRTSTK